VRLVNGSGLDVAVTAALGVAVTSVEPIGGGCIAAASRLRLADGRSVFAKSGAQLPFGILRVEAEGLDWLRVEGGAPVPEVLAVSNDVLVLEWVEPGNRVAGTDERLGRGLATIHRQRPAHFGWHRDGFIGSIAQRNSPPGDDWPSFWMTRRVEPLARVACDRGAVDTAVVALVGRLADRIDGLAGPAEPPARVHGDLWSGNVHVDTRGTSWLIDPAAYGGHREVDLAMLHLFGQPSKALLAAYGEAFPLAEGWRDRLALWQLEPLLAHAVMFGGNYGDAARGVLERYVGRR
jgi:fructosamine-3-kinase